MSGVQPVKKYRTVKSSRGRRKRSFQTVHLLSRPPTRSTKQVQVGQ